MNHIHFRSIRIVVVLLLSMAWCPLGSRAESSPQFAFSIGSNQVPSGLFPIGLGVDPAGRIYISSLWYVIKVNTNGAFLTQWGSQGTGPGQFSYAGPSAFDNSGHLYISDSYNDRIEEFDTNGNFLGAWGSYGTRAGQFDSPAGMAVSPSGLIYVSDANNFRIQVFSKPGVFLKQFGGNGTNLGQFSFPGVIAIDSSNNLYVVDAPGGSFDNYRVQKFSADGTFLTQWGAFGTNTAGSIEVEGIATDPANNVYVSDAANNVVQKFSSQGVFLSQWGTSGKGTGQFNGPSGIALDSTGNYVYVADYYNARIDVFAYSALAPLIYQPPTNQVVPAGITLSLDAGVFGASPLGYQWQFEGANLFNATAASLVISNISLAASGSYSVSASNSLGTADSPAASLTVLPVVVNTLAASGISATGAVFKGSIWVGSNPSGAWFEWGTSTNYGNITGFTNLAPGSLLPVAVAQSALTGEVDYHYRLVGSNSLGVVYGQDAQFEVGLKPTVTTLPVTPLSPGSVLLNASVNPEARDTSVFFRWGGFNVYQHNTPTNQLPNLVGGVTVQNQITGLVAGVTYAFQAVASNDMGVVSGSIVSFVAPPWVLLSTPAPQVWTSLAISADGASLAAAGPFGIDLSPDSGVSWGSNTLPSEPWQAVRISADGSRLVALAGGTQPGPGFVSTNFGKSWFKSNGPNRNWFALAGSGDGSRLAAGDVVGQTVLTSTNGGLDWQTNSPAVPAPWSTVASSADGQRLVVAAGGAERTFTNGVLYTSADAGLSWSSNNLPVSSWQSVASSADGKTLLAAVGGFVSGPIYVSTNAGASWSLTTAPLTNWQKVALSADGTKLVAMTRVAAPQIMISTNLGASWQSYVLPQAFWSSLALSADGSRLFAAGDQNIVALQMAPTPMLETFPTSGQLSLSWIIPSTPLILQHSADLSTAQWTNVPAAPSTVFTNLRYQVTVPEDAQSGFYRLRNSD